VQSQIDRVRNNADSAGGSATWKFKLRNPIYSAVLPSAE